MERLQIFLQSQFGESSLFETNNGTEVRIGKDVVSIDYETLAVHAVGEKAGVLRDRVEAVVMRAAEAIAPLASLISDEDLAKFEADLDGNGVEETPNSDEVKVKTEIEPV